MLLGNFEYLKSNKEFAAFADACREAEQSIKVKVAAFNVKVHPDFHIAAGVRPREPPMSV
jgi:hypothetical protein